jgi:hypothetical protein
MVMEDGRPARRFSRIAHRGAHIFATSRNQGHDRL